MKKFYLHIGTHKTGSTALQKSLYENEIELNKEGFEIIKHTNLAFRKELNRVEDYSIFTSDFKSLISSAFKKKRKVILAWEGFAGGLIGKYKNRNLIFEFISQSLPDDVKLHVSCFLRRQDDFVQSAFSQAKHEGKFDAANQLLALKYEKGFDWTQLISDLENQLPSAVYHILPYDPIVLQTKSVVELYADVVGSDTLKNTQAKQANVGMSKEAAELYQRLYNRIENLIIRKRFRKLLQQKMNKGLFKEYHFFDYESKNRLLKMCDKQNQSVAIRFWKKEYGIDNFSPINRSEDENAMEGVQEKVILELLAMEEARLENESRSIAIKIGKKLNKLFSL